MNKATPLLLLLMSTATGAVAQQLYKSIGSDGKVVFSDKPIDGKTKVATMKGTVLRPVEAPVDASVKPGTRMLVAAPESVVTPEIEDTMLRVMEMVEFGKRYEPVCAVSPKASKVFSEAHKGWMVRNALYIEQQKRLLMEVVSPHRRIAIQQRLASLRGVVSPAASSAARVEWCDSIATGLNSGSSDIVKPAMLAIPLTAYRSK